VNGNSSTEVIPTASKKLNRVSWIAWFIAFGLTVFAGFLGWRKYQAINREIVKPVATEIAVVPIKTPDPGVGISVSSLPLYEEAVLVGGIPRRVSMYTNVPNRPRQDVVAHTVNLGDSVFGIATGFNIQPETVLWSNYDLLKDNPHALSAGMVLKIPPTNGVYYKLQEGDTFESLAVEFETDPEDILYWPGNRFDLTDPKLIPDAWIMIPDGQREFQQWIIPVMPRGASGVSAGIYGAGACPGGYEGLYGSGAFIWPTINRSISGNDYWSGHLAIDIGSAPGEPISSSDTGVIVFAGWASGGYGYVVAIDHGNGYSTLYAHLSSVNVGCGQSVVQGQTIGYGGSTGNSTGPHLHFEIRYQGGFVNPWYVLPAP
jgi:murein DD-endopeptidase MepM/ murein hydrolase activator NlpD